MIECGLMNPGCVEIDASGLHFSELNSIVRSAVSSGKRDIVLRNVAGQRYIGTNLYNAAESLDQVNITIYGTPGNDLGAFLDGPTITVFGNAMDGIGNTMNRGLIAVHGRAGDIAGFSARGGEIFIKDNAGYRTGIHMKEYMTMKPVMVIGGTVQDFLGEYMAGGVIIILGLTLKKGESHHCRYVGTGMHGGAIFIRGNIEEHQLSKTIGAVDLTPEDQSMLIRYVEKYSALFGVDVSFVDPAEFTKLVPLSVRPYKKLYAY
jgi:glutamate synthase domain-containing protein 3